ncbi:MAG: glycosyltransferase family 4 protein [Nitrosopumilaceae archaeon]
MNVLLLTQFLSTTKGGGEYVFSVIANALANRGHNVWIITHKIENEDYTHFHKNVRILLVSSIRYEGGLPPSFKDNIKFVFISVWLGLQLIKKENIELIHSNNFSPALAGSILSYLMFKPHITTVHDIFSLCGKKFWNMWGKQSNISKFNVLLAPLFEKMMVRLTHHAIHTVSEATKDDLIKFGAKKPIYVIHNTVNSVKYENISPNPFQFVFVGRLVFYKNLETVIRAISIVKKSHAKIRLMIIGGGPQKEYLVDLTKQLKLEKNIEFCGYVSEEDKLKMISSSIAMVFPSLCEGFGLVILESFSCSRPVIVSNVRPLSDIIDDKKDGVVIEAMNENKWAEVIAYFILNPHIALEMGENGRKKLENKYNQESMITKIESMYHETASRCSPINSN